MESAQKPTAVDLFSGGGGLSLGLRQAGFNVTAAVEIEPEACRTYEANHPTTILYKKDIRHISGKELIKSSPSGKIDLVAGCPPCQGFSQLTAKYRRSDLRNYLVYEFSRLIAEIRPAVFMMENVPGLTQKGNELLNEMLSRIANEGYHFESKVLNVANYGVPQFRRRLVIIGSLLGKPGFPEATHSGNDGTKEKFLTVRDAIGDLNLGRPMTLKRLGKNMSPRDFGWHIVRDLSAINRLRLKAAKAGKSRTEIPLELRPRCHQSSNAGFTNVYGRMSWSQPAPTITGGCTTLSKGRFGHPTNLRTISVREAAVLQGFPINYIIDTEFMEHACQIIGNALPPRFALAMGTHCLKHLQKYERI